MIHRAVILISSLSISGRHKALVVHCEKDALDEFRDKGAGYVRELPEVAKQSNFSRAGDAVTYLNFTTTEMFA